MPAIRHASKRKPPPEGFSDIEDDLLIFANKMKDAQNKTAPTGPKHQAQWEVFQISHQRSRYVYDLYYEKEAISKQLYDWLLKNGYADAMLIAKWKKQGYEKVCFFSLSLSPTNEASEKMLTLWVPSCAACAASRQRRQTSTAPASAGSRELSSKTTKMFSVSAAGAGGALRPTRATTFWLLRHWILRRKPPSYIRVRMESRGVRCIRMTLDGSAKGGLEKCICGLKR